MQAKGIINLSKFKIILCKVKANGKLILFVLIFILGFLTAVLGYDNISFSNNLFDFLVKRFCDLRTNTSFLTIAFNSFLNILLLLVITFSSGTTLMGLLFIPCSVFLSGFGFGILGAGLYSTFSYSGVAFFAVLIIPWAVLATISVIFSAIEAFDFSLFLTKLVGFNEKCDNVSVKFKEYCIKHLLLCVFVLIAAVLDGILSLNFFTSFNIF